MLNCESDVCVWLFWSLLFGPAATHQGSGGFFPYFFQCCQAYQYGAFIQKHSSIITISLSLTHSHVFAWLIFSHVHPSLYFFHLGHKYQEPVWPATGSALDLSGFLWSLKSLGKMTNALKVYGKWIIQLKSVKVCQFGLLSVWTSVKLRSARDFLTLSNCTASRFGWLVLCANYNRETTLWQRNCEVKVGHASHGRHWSWIGKWSVRFSLWIWRRMINVLKVC